MTENFWGVGGGNSHQFPHWRYCASDGSGAWLSFGGVSGGVWPGLFWHALALPGLGTGVIFGIKCARQAIYVLNMLAGLAPSLAALACRRMDLFKGRMARGDRPFLLRYMGKHAGAFGIRRGSQFVSACACACREAAH